MGMKQLHFKFVTVETITNRSKELQKQVKVDTVLNLFILFGFSLRKDHELLTTPHIKMIYLSIFQTKYTISVS